MSTKVCIKCKRRKRLHEYYYRRDKNIYSNVCKKCYMITVRKWRDKNKQLCALYKSRYKERHAERYLAHKKVTDAVRRGDLIPQPCELCIKKNTKKIQAHHSDYRFPLRVHWLCVKHHGYINRLMRVKEAA